MPDVSQIPAGHGRVGMPPALSFLVSRFGVANPIAGRPAWLRAARIAPTAALHVAALAVMVFTETDLVAAFAFLLTWGASSISSGSSCCAVPPSRPPCRSPWW